VKLCQEACSHCEACLRAACASTGDCAEAVLVGCHHAARRAICESLLQCCKTHPPSASDCDHLQLTAIFCRSECVDCHFFLCHKNACQCSINRLLGLSRRFEFEYLFVLYQGARARKQCIVHCNSCVPGWVVAKSCMLWTLVWSQYVAQLAMPSVSVLQLSAEVMLGSPGMK
jgi:hypothetical protein